MSNQREAVSKGPLRSFNKKTESSLLLWFWDLVFAFNHSNPIFHVKHVSRVVGERVVN